MNHDLELAGGAQKQGCSRGGYRRLGVGGVGGMCLSGPWNDEDEEGDRFIVTDAAMVGDMKSTNLAWARETRSVHPDDPGQLIIFIMIPPRSTTRSTTKTFKGRVGARG